MQDSSALHNGTENMLVKNGFYTLVLSFLFPSFPPIISWVGVLPSFGWVEDLGKTQKVTFWGPEPYQKQNLLMLVLLPVLTGVFLALDERNTIFPPNYPLFAQCCCHLNIKPMLLKENIFNKRMSQRKYFQQKDVTRIFVFLFHF